MNMVKLAIILILALASDIILMWSLADMISQLSGSGVWFIGVVIYFVLVLLWANIIEKVSK